jgi:hypothetical protein
MYDNQYGEDSRVMKEDSLVILKGDERIEFLTGVLLPNKAYRCIKLSSSTKSELLIGGFKFDQDGFEAKFEFMYDKIMRDFKEMGLVNDKLEANGKVKFRNGVNFHKYGKYSILTFGKNKDEFYAFYPMQGDKLQTFNECYRMLVDLVEGDMDLIDCKDIQFGNKMPLSYGNISYK